MEGRHPSPGGPAAAPSLSAMLLGPAPALEPRELQPQTWRPLSASSRKANARSPGSFLEQTLTKLHVDSSRVENLPLKPLPPETPRREANPRRTEVGEPGRAFASAELERLRKAFSEEAELAIRTMRSVVEESNVSRLTSILEKWHDAGSNETMMLREHVQDLLKLNCSLRQTTLDQLSTDEFAKLRSCIADMSDRLDEIMAYQRRGHDRDLAALAEQTAERTVEVLSSDISALSAFWHQGYDEQRERYRGEEERWSKVLGQLERIQERLGRVEASFGNQSDMLRVDAEMVNRQALRQLDAKLQKEMEEERSQLTRHVTGSLREELGGLLERSVLRFTGLVEAGLQEQREELLGKVEASAADGRKRDAMLTEAMEELREASRRRIREDAEEEALCVSSFDGALRELHSRLDRMDGDYREEVKCWRAEAEKMGEKSAQARAALEASRAEAGRREAEAQRLGAEGRELKLQLRAAREELETSTAIPAPDLLRKIKELEARKNIRVDLKAATVETVKSLDFESKRTSEGPVASFTDARKAETVLRDVAELAQLLSAPMVVESYVKSNNTDASVQTGNARAGVVKDQLEVLGVKKGVIGTKGVAGNKNTKGPSLIFRFNVFSPLA